MLTVQKAKLFGGIRVVKGLSIEATFGKSCTPCGFIGSIQKISLSDHLGDARQPVFASAEQKNSPKRNGVLGLFSSE
jgi:hypothetical protein